jgi:hypothetical protein
LDIATTHEDLHTVNVLLGNGSGGFTANGMFGVDTAPNSLAAGDFDNDGRTDLVTTNDTPNTLGTLSILINQLDAWTNLGSGLPGVAGIPYFEGTGSLQAGSAGALTLSSVASAAPATLFVSFANTPTPFRCGTLVPVPIGTFLNLQTHVDGKLGITWTAWPSGLSLYLQHTILDPSAVCGVSLSNALRVEVP